MLSNDDFLIIKDPLKYLDNICNLNCDKTARPCQVQNKGSYGTTAQNKDVNNPADSEYEQQVDDRIHRCCNKEQYGKRYLAIEHGRSEKKHDQHIEITYEIDKDFIKPVFHMLSPFPFLSLLVLPCLFPFLG